MQFKYVRNKKKLVILSEDEFNRVEQQCRTNRAIDDLNYSLRSIDESNNLYKQLTIGGLFSVFIALVGLFICCIAIVCRLWG